MGSSTVGAACDMVTIVQVLEGFQKLSTYTKFLKLGPKNIPVDRNRDARPAPPRPWGKWLPWGAWP